MFAAPDRGLEGAGTDHDRAWAAAVVFEGGRALEASVMEGFFTASYAPGYLALRQLPLLTAAVRALRTPIDVLLVNATGGDHPRGAGLALHVGHDLRLPSIGVTDRPLVAEGVAPAARAGARAELRVEGRLAGYRLRVRADARPICVSEGWRTDAETAATVVLATCAGERTPAPLREARRLARAARSLGSAVG